MNFLGRHGQIGRRARSSSKVSGRSRAGERARDGRRRAQVLGEEAADLAIAVAQWVAEAVRADQQDMIADAAFGSKSKTGRAMTIGDHAAC
jgi:hypothetical protein